MLDHNDERTINANVDEVLSALHANLKEHNEILAEARVGYLKEAKTKLEEAADKIQALDMKIQEEILKDEGATGALIILNPIFFTLTVPTSHSREFQTAIRMLELHKGAHESNPDNVGIPATIELKALDVKRFVLNDWHWMDEFINGTRAYSAKSAMIADKGFR